MTGQFLFSALVLVVCVGVGGSYLAKSLGWFGGLAVERLFGPARPWSRWRRRVTAVLCMVLGVMFFLGFNWIEPRSDPAFFAGYWLVLVLLCLLAFLLGIQDFREVRTLGRKLRTSRHVVSNDQKSRVMNQLKRSGGGNGGSPREQAEER